MLGSARAGLVGLIVGEAILDRDAMPLDQPRVFQSLPERDLPVGVVTRPPGGEIADHRHRRLLRTRRERPRNRRAAEKRVELAPPHSITSSARSGSADVIVNPIFFAVFMLITNSNLVGVCTGSSPGFSPLRMRSVYLAAPRH